MDGVVVSAVSGEEESERTAPAARQVKKKSSGAYPVEDFILIYSLIIG